jgi:hypothetical protein
MAIYVNKFILRHSFFPSKVAENEIDYGLVDAVNDRQVGNLGEDGGG